MEAKHRVKMHKVKKTLGRYRHDGSCSDQPRSCQS